MKMKKNIKENDAVKTQKLKNKLKSTGLSDREANDLINKNKGDVDTSFNNKDSENKVAVKLLTKDKLKESNGIDNKVNMDEFAKWLDIKPEHLQLGLMITEMSDPDFAYNHLQNTGMFEASQAVYDIYFEYGSLPEAIQAFNTQVNK